MGNMKKNKGGRPTVVIDYDTLQKLCAIHCTGEECASILGMDYDTLDRALKREKKGGFTDYFKKHSASGKMSLRRRQFEQAESGNTTMLVWLGKQYLGQTDKVDQHLDQTSSDGSMSPTRIELVAPKNATVKNKAD